MQYTYSTKKKEYKISNKNTLELKYISKLLGCQDPGGLLEVSWRSWQDFDFPDRPDRPDGS